jgi:CubicO group peptidase (beta-lactamase class C family)
VGLDVPVAEYIAGFEQHGKGDITVRHLLSHRAGLAATPTDSVDLDLVGDWNRVVEVLCSLAPATEAGQRMAYHPLMSGFVLGEIVRQVSGKDLRTFLHDEVTVPLGMQTFSFGVPEAMLEKVAVDAVTGPKTPGLIQHLLKRGLGARHEKTVELSNDPRFRTAIVPSGNVISTPHDTCLFYETLLREGTFDQTRIWAPHTVRMAVASQNVRQIDGTLLMPVRYGLGFILGEEGLSAYGYNAPKAYGHIGFTSVVAWADPERDISVAFLNTGKPILTLGQLVWANVLRTIASLIPRSRRIR